MLTGLASTFSLIPYYILNYCVRLQMLW